MRATDFVQSYIEAWNQRDPEGVRDHLTTDGIYCDVPENTIRTHDDWIANLTDFFANNRHRYELIGEILTGKDTIAFQYQMSRCDAVEEDGSPRTFSGAEFMSLHGNAAVNITDYYDVPARVRRPTVTALSASEAQKIKYAKSGLNSEQLLEHNHRLEQIMQVQQIYLWPDLTLPKLAQAVECSVNHLSQVINSGIGMSFFDYLNHHRIAHARKLLSRPDQQGSAILNIAFTVGFNSNSAFYVAFKKWVGQTPAEFRRAKLRKSH